MVFYCFLSSECERFARIDYAWNHCTIVDHSFGYQGVAFPLISRVFAIDYRVFAMRFGSGTHGGTHVRLVFIGHFGARFVHNSGCPYARPLPHENLITRDGN